MTENDEDAEVKIGRAKWSEQLDRIWAFGPHRVGPNILLNCLDGYTCSKGPFFDIDTSQKPTENAARNSCIAALENAIITGFSLAALAGPLCEEPLTGVCFELLDVDFAGCHQSSSGSSDNTAPSADDAEEIDWHCAVCLQSNQGGKNCTTCSTARPVRTIRTELGNEFIPPTSATLAKLTGTTISTMTQACRSAFACSAGGVRLVEPVYDCQVRDVIDVTSPNQSRLSFVNYRTYLLCCR